MTYDRAMMEALEADGEKLRQLTGEDHGPYFSIEPPEVWKDCDECGGEGSILIPEIVSKWSIDPPGSYSIPCKACNGSGGMICEAEGRVV